MIYLPEDYYFWNNKDISFQKAVLVTAKTVSEWCDSYEAKILTPKKGVQVKHKLGNFSEDVDEKEKVIEDILNWVWDHSIDVMTFCLYLNKINKDGDLARVFEHHDDTCCWGLNLSKEQFAELQKSWKSNDLPVDLFYHKDQIIITIPKYYEKWSKLRRTLFGGTHSFSPKTWESMKKEGEDKKYIIQKPE